MGKKSVLFVCLGNICRSPMAEAIFLHLINERGVADKWTVDSAALGDWHVGKPPDKRTMYVLKTKNVPYSHKARQVTLEDYTNFDYIFGMDHDNISELEGKSPKNTTATIALLGSFDPEGELIIRDPYYDRDHKGFQKCYEQCVRCCTAFLDVKS